MVRTSVPPSKAARLYAAAMATLDDGGPAFGVRTVQRGAPSGLERTRAAYADPSAYPLPNPRNWLSSVVNTDLKDVPGIARNALSGTARAAWDDPMSVLAPFPKGAGAATQASKAARATRATRLAEYETLKVAEAARIAQARKATTLYEQSERYRAHAASFPAGTKTRKALVKTSREWADAAESATGQAGIQRNIPYKFTRTGPRSDVPEVPQLMRRKSDTPPVQPGQSRNFRGSTTTPASVSAPMSGTTRVRRNTGEGGDNVVNKGSAADKGFVVSPSRSGRVFVIHPPGRKPSILDEAYPTLEEAQKRLNAPPHKTLDINIPGLKELGNALGRARKKK